MIATGEISAANLSTGHYYIACSRLSRLVFALIVLIRPNISIGMIARVMDVLMSGNDLRGLCFVINVSKPILEVQGFDTTTGNISCIPKVTVKRDHETHPWTFTAALASVAFQPLKTRIFR